MIYLDNHATTKIDDTVLKEMQPYFDVCFANPSSTHSFGIQVKQVVEKSRKTIAELINAQSNQIFFTSGSSESNNTIIKGLWFKNIHKQNIIITSAIEHPSIINCADYLSKISSTNWSKINVDQEGNLSDFEDKINSAKILNNNILLCSIHAANNEIGTTYDLEYLGEVCKKNNIFFHTDATQAIGKIKIDVVKQNIDSLSFSAHKINGPKGIGVLYIKDYSSIDPLISGGLQEKIRSGTINVPGIVGLSKALQINCSFDWNKIKNIRDELITLLKINIPDLLINGSIINRLPNNLNVSIPGVKSEIFIKGMSDVIISSGSACKSGDDLTSDVLLAIKSKYPNCALRFGLDKNTTLEEIKYAADKVSEIRNKIGVRHDS